MKIRDVFSLDTARSLPRSEVRMLLTHSIARDAAWLVAHDDETLSDEQRTQIESLMSRRSNGEPIAYLIGTRDFYGRTFRCSPAALIPRPETELLIDTALAIFAVRSDPSTSSAVNAAPSVLNAASSVRGEPVEPHTTTNTLRILDVGTGTGCIAITLALECERARIPAHITALDISADALALAKENAQQLGATHIEFVQSNWFTAIDENATFDLIVSNPPYIAPGDEHLTQGDLRFEPTIALADAIDGLESYRQLARGARKHLRQGGTLIVEHGYDQGESVPTLFREAGFGDVEMVRDLAGLARVTSARARVQLQQTL